MLFSSLTFLYMFLPCVTLLYFISPKQTKNFVLLVSSLVFYAWGEPRFVAVMLVSIIMGYVFGILIEKFNERPLLSKSLTVLSVISSLSTLFYFKYANFFIENFSKIFGISVPLLNVVLPIGISFYTFQILSYTVDVYRGNTKAQKNFINLATYISFFPQLIAGPIVRYTHIEKELSQRTHSFEKIAYGIKRFIYGLSKKIILANSFGELCALFNQSSEKTVLFFWIYIISFMLQIYFDFSGYSDMAIGLGKIFGFNFPENFRYPFASKTITDFWRRWHITLGSWFRDYVYIPLGGSRCSKPKMLLNIFTVWMLTGFWHGAEWNFVLWGIYFAILLIIEKFFLLKFLGKRKILSHIYVFFFITVSFVIFATDSPNAALTHLASMFSLSKLPLVSPESIYYLKSFAPTLILGLIISAALLKKMQPAIATSKLAKNTLEVSEIIFILTLFTVCTAYLVDGSFNPFLYFKF
ncbi:MAG: MBOAT family protein [Clostridia bacterium]|nr:MBOAT family protein [Clostridia bacterium]